MGEVVRVIGDHFKKLDLRVTHFAPQFVFAKLTCPHGMINGRECAKCASDLDNAVDRARAEDTVSEPVS